MKKSSLKRIFSLLLTTAILTCVLSGCSESGSSDGNNADTGGLAGKKVTVLLKSYTHMFWVEAANEAKALGDKYNCEVEILAPTVSNRCV